MKSYILIFTLTMVASGCRKPYLLGGDFEKIANRGGPYQASESWEYKQLYTDYKKFNSKGSFQEEVLLISCFCQKKDSLEVNRKKPKVNRYVTIVKYIMCSNYAMDTVKRTAILLTTDGKANFATTSQRFGSLESRKTKARKYLTNTQNIETYLQDKRRSNYVYKGFYKKNEDNVFIIFQKGKKPTYNAIGFKGKTGIDGGLILNEVYSKGSWKRLAYTYYTMENEKVSGIKLHLY